MYQIQKSIKTEIDIIDDNVFESVYTREYNSTIQEDIIEKSMKDFSDVKNKNSNHLNLKKINANQSSDLE